jgi:hypothetical protein
LTSPYPKEHRSAEDRYDMSLARGLIEAFGERKTLTQWSRDPRCAVQRKTLEMRLACRWEPERAITTAKHDRSLGDFTVDGRTLSLPEWCKVMNLRYHTLYKRVALRGMSIEDAIQKGSKDTIRLITAFGNTRPAYRWVVDDRAGVASLGTLLKRLDAGWSAEQAITTPPDNQSTLDSGTKYPAFGRRLSIPTWARLSNIPDAVLRRWTTRLDGNVENALLMLGWFPDWVSHPDEVTVDIDQLQRGDVVVRLDHQTATVTVRRRDWNRTHAQA